MSYFGRIAGELPKKLVQRITNWSYLQGVLESHYIGRPYHNLEHVLDLLTKMKNLPVERPVEFAVAILFHDTIYDLRALPGENEEASAMLANYMGPKCITNISWQTVINLIRATIHDGKLNERHLSNDELLMADIDMSNFELTGTASLGTSALVMAEYMKIYPTQDVLNGHIAFLKTLRERGKIFYTSHFSNEIALKEIDRKIRHYEQLRDNNQEIGCR